MIRSTRNMGGVFLVPRHQAVLETTYPLISTFPFGLAVPNFTPTITNISSNVLQSRPSLLKKTSANNWDAGSASIQKFSGDCRFTYCWRAPCENLKMIGISTDTTCSTFSTIDYGVNLQNPGTSDRVVGIYQNGVVLGGDHTVATMTTDMYVLLEVERVGTTVSLYQTDSRNAATRTKVVDFTNSSTGDLYVNLAMFGQGVQFDNLDMMWHAI